MLRTIRLTLAVIFFALITLLFLDFTGTLHAWFGWMAKIQFLPAVLALNIGVVLFLAVLTWYSDASTAPSSARWEYSRTLFPGSPPNGRKTVSATRPH